MKILNLDTNAPYDLETIPDELDDDIRYAVLDNSNTNSPDFFYIPLIFLESFNSPAVVVQAGNVKIKMPVDWQILIGEADHGDLETVPLSSLNDRGFSAFQLNPLTGYSPNFLPIEIVDIYQDVTWYVPKLKNGQFLCVPIDGGENPRCLYIVKDISRSCEVVDFGKIL